MALTNRIFPYLLSGIACLMIPFVHAAELHVKGMPEFKDYPADINKGPFTTRLDLSSEQEKYSSYWKKITNSELKKPVNFAGHYRIYTDDKSTGNECLDHQGGVCGWVIDKLSGTVVVQLPAVAGTFGSGKHCSCNQRYAAWKKSGCDWVRLLRLRCGTAIPWHGGSRYRCGYESVNTT